MGAFLFCAVLLTLTGITGWFATLSRTDPGQPGQRDAGGNPVPVWAIRLHLASDRHRTGGGYGPHLPVRAQAVPALHHPRGAGRRGDLVRRHRSLWQPGGAGLDARPPGIRDTRLFAASADRHRVAALYRHYVLAEHARSGGAKGLRIRDACVCQPDLHRAGIAVPGTVRRFCLQPRRHNRRHLRRTGSG